MNEIPCIKDKCLKYPMCKNKIVISCNTLFEYATNISPDNTTSTFPKLNTLSSNKAVMVFYTSNSYSVYYTGQIVPPDLRPLF